MEAVVYAWDESECEDVMSLLTGEPNECAVLPAAEGPLGIAAAALIEHYGNDEFEISHGAAIPAAPSPSKGATAPTACGLTRVATDGERIGRMGWMPGA